jgi:hypothetical protein
MNHSLTGDRSTGSSRRPSLAWLALFVQLGCGSKQGGRESPVAPAAQVPPVAPLEADVATLARDAPFVRVLPQLDGEARVVERADGTTRVLFGSLRAEATDKRIVFSDDRFASRIVAAARVANGWVFLAHDGVAARADSFLGPLTPLGEMPRPTAWGGELMASAPLGAGRLAIPSDDPAAGLWTSDGSAPLAPAAGAPPGAILSVAFVDAAHGMIVVDGGELFRTDDGGASFTRVSLGNEAAAHVTVAGTNFRVRTSAQDVLLDRDGHAVGPNGGAVAVVPPGPRPDRVEDVLRARLRAAALRRYPELLAESFGGLVPARGRVLVQVAGSLRALTASPTADELTIDKKRPVCAALPWGASFALVCQDGLYRVDPKTLAQTKLTDEPIEAERVVLSADGAHASWECDLEANRGYAATAKSTCVLVKRGAIRRTVTHDVAGMHDAELIAMRWTKTGLVLVALDAVAGSDLRTIDVPLPKGTSPGTMDGYRVSPDGAVVTGAVSTYDRSAPKQSWLIRVVLASGEVAQAPLPAGAERVGFVDADRGVAVAADLSSVWITRDAGKQWVSVGTSVQGKVGAQAGLGGGRRIRCAAERCVIDGRVVVSFAGDPPPLKETVLASRLPVGAADVTWQLPQVVACTSGGATRTAPTLENPDSYQLDAKGRTRYQVPGADVELKVSGKLATTWKLSWQGRDWQGPYRAQAAGPVPPADLDGGPEYQLKHATREGVLIYRDEYYWVPAGGKPVAIVDPSLELSYVVDILSLPQGRVALLVKFQPTGAALQFHRLLVADARGRIVATRTFHWRDDEFWAAGLALQGGVLGVTLIDLPTLPQWFLPVDASQARRELAPLELAKLPLCSKKTLKNVPLSIVLSDTQVSFSQQTILNDVWRVYLRGADALCVQGMEFSSSRRVLIEAGEVYAAVSPSGELQAEEYFGNVYQSHVQKYRCTLPGAGK